VRIRHRAVALASAVAVGAAMCLAFAGAAGASPARPLARATAVSAQVTGRSAHSARPDATTTFIICDEATGDCWTSNGKGHDLKLTGATAYAEVYPLTGVDINGKPETTYELKVYGSGVPGLCVEASYGTQTYEEACTPPGGSVGQAPAEEFWYTPSEALYSLGVSETTGKDWCEIDTNGVVQNAPCTSPNDQPADMTFVSGP
jgi:hypothetical protein